MELRLPQLHDPGMPLLAVPSCPASNASSVFHSSLARDVSHEDGMSVDANRRTRSS